MPIDYLCNQVHGRQQKSLQRGGGVASQKKTSHIEKMPPPPSHKKTKVAKRLLH